MFDNFDIYSKIAISILLINSVILSNLISIGFIFFGNYLLKKFNIENKYPSLKKIIELRLKFQQFYLILNLSLIFFGIFVQIAFALFVLFF